MLGPVSLREVRQKPVFQASPREVGTLDIQSTLLCPGRMWNLNFFFCSHCVELEEELCCLLICLFKPLFIPLASRHLEYTRFHQPSETENKPIPLGSPWKSWNFGCVIQLFLPSGTLGAVPGVGIMARVSQIFLPASV